MRALHNTAFLDLNGDTSMNLTFLRRLAAPVAALALAACSGTTDAPAGMAHITVQLTDAPSVEFDSAVVEIGRVTLIPVEGDPIVITEEGGRFDLLDLQNGVTATLGDEIIPAGDYSELRLVVTSAYVGLADPYAFENGDTESSLKVPSGAQSGIKVKLRSMDADTMVPFVSIDENVVLVVDFDVHQNFKTQGNFDTPAGLKGVLFTPVLRAVVRDVAGSIAGAVRSEADSTPLPGFQVLAKLLGDSVAASAITGEDGNYVIHFLAPGTYEVKVDSLTAGPDTVVVGESENVTGVDFYGTKTGT
jgi:hypothetical protein